MDHSLAPSTLAHAGLLRCWYRRASPSVDRRFSAELILLLRRLVDIISYHYYGSGDIKRVKKDCELAKKYGKV